MSKYYYLNGLRVAKAVDGVYTWIHSDHLHSATIVTDDTGAELRRLAYRAFGEEAENVGSGNAPQYSYTGKERDATGLMYYGARYYDPALARFITPDTIYDRGTQGLNRYSYVLNNPIVYNDPSGNSALPPTLSLGTDYDALPYALEPVDTGNWVAENVAAAVLGIYNGGAYLVNTPFVAGGAIEEVYNGVTEAVTGRKGLNGEGLEGDMFALESSGLPVGASMAQGIRHSAPLLKGKIAEAAEKAAKCLKKLFGGRGKRSNEEIRQWYVNKTKQVSEMNEQWVKEGLSPKERAYRAWKIRHDARLKARKMMRNADEVDMLRARDTKKYGNPDGPTFEYEYSKYEAQGFSDDDIYESIIEGSGRTNKEYNQRYNANNE